MKALRFCIFFALAAFQTWEMKRNSSDVQNSAQRAAQKQQRNNKNEACGVENEQRENERQHLQRDLDHYNMNNGYGHNPHFPTMPVA